MAAQITYTPHLKLRISSQLSADSRYNLEKIDTLATTFIVDTTDTLQLRSRGNITIQPRSADVGGDGTGGHVSIGTASHPLSGINLYGPVTFSAGFTVTDSLVLSGTPFSTTISRNLAQMTDLTFTLPPGYGNAGQFMASDGSGGLVWSNTPIGSGTVKQATFVWDNSDGSIFTLVHGLGSSLFQYSVYDLDTGEPVTVQSIVVLNPNAIRLTASEAPDIHWGVTLRGEW
jgi:hypothetical protein